MTGPGCQDDAPTKTLCTCCRRPPPLHRGVEVCVPPHPSLPFLPSSPLFPSGGPTLPTSWGAWCRGVVHACSFLLFPIFSTHEQPDFLSLFLTHQCTRQVHKKTRYVLMLLPPPLRRSSRGGVDEDSFPLLSICIAHTFVSSFGDLVRTFSIWLLVVGSGYSLSFSSVSLLFPFLFICPAILCVHS